MTSLPHIMFVDDEPLVHAALRRQLRGMEGRWRMTFLSDPKHALEVIRSDPPTVAVLDIRMPRLSGLDIAAALQADGLATICLILSGSSDFASAIEAINRGRVFRYYNKPCRPEDLIAGIGEAIAEAARQGMPPPTTTAGDAAAPALDVLATGVIVVGPGARLIHANRAGAAMLSDGDGLFLDANGIVRARVAEETARLHAATQPEIDGIGAALSIARGRADTPLRVIVAPLDASGRVAYFVSDPENPPPVDPRRLAGLFGLTAAEARLAAALVTGSDLGEAAEDGGITRETARSYLKQVFQKTGASRQAELVQMVLTALAPTGGKI